VFLEVELGISSSGQLPLVDDPTFWQPNSCPVEWLFVHHSGFSLQMYFCLV